MGKNKKPAVTPGFGRKPVESPVIKLDLGCGPNKREGFTGVDIAQFDGKVDVVIDLSKKWPWKDCSVSEAVTSHFIEHLDAGERIHFINELYRVLKPEAKCQVTVPHWASQRAYGDLTHKWPPVSEFWFYYLSKEWRKANAPHSKYADEVNFEVTWGYSVLPQIMARTQEYQQNAIQFYKEACTDIIAAMVRK